MDQPPFLKGIAAATYLRSQLICYKTQSKSGIKCSFLCANDIKTQPVVFTI